VLEHQPQQRQRDQETVRQHQTPPTQKGMLPIVDDIGLRNNRHTILISGPIRNVLCLSTIEMSYPEDISASHYNPFRHG
jgi:hypothetical protein